MLTLTIETQAAKVTPTQTFLEEIFEEITETTEYIQRLVLDEILNDRFRRNSRAMDYE